MPEYQHNWIEYMPFDALASTAVSIFLGWRLVKDMLGYDPLDTEEIRDAMQILWDEMCERDAVERCYAAILGSDGMDAKAFHQMMEMVE